MDLNFSPNPELLNSNPNVYLSMGLTAENVAKKYNITRESQQEFCNRIVIKKLVMQN